MTWFVFVSTYCPWWDADSMFAFRSTQTIHCCTPHCCSANGFAFVCRWVPVRWEFRRMFGCACDTAADPCRERHSLVTLLIRFAFQCDTDPNWNWQRWNNSGYSRPPHNSNCSNYGCTSDCDCRSWCCFRHQSNPNYGICYRRGSTIHSTCQRLSISTEWLPGIQLLCWSPSCNWCCTAMPFGFPAKFSCFCISMQFDWNSGEFSPICLGALFWVRFSHFWQMISERSSCFLWLAHYHTLV